MQRNSTLDILKLVMAYMVVGIHALMPVDLSRSFLLTNGLLRMPVPVFLLISGFYFYRATDSKSFIRWVKHIFILYAVWTLAYSYAWIPLVLSSNNSTGFLAKILLFGYHHLWYLPGMLGAGLMMFLLRKASSTTLATATVALFLAGVFLQYASAYHESIRALPNCFRAIWGHRNFLFVSFPFFCIGYLIDKHQIHNRITRQQIAALLTGGIAVLLLESYINLRSLNNAINFDNLASLIIVCPAIFIYYCKHDSLFDSKYMAATSAAVYFIHPIIIDLLRINLNIKSAALAAITILASSLLAFPIIILNRRLKHLL